MIWLPVFEHIYILHVCSVDNRKDGATDCCLHQRPARTHDVFSTFFQSIYYFLTTNHHLLLSIIFSAAHRHLSTTSSNHGSSVPDRPDQAVPNSMNGPPIQHQSMVPSLAHRWVNFLNRSNPDVHWLVDVRRIIQDCLRNVLMPSVVPSFWRSRVLLRWVVLYNVYNVGVKVVGHNFNVCVWGRDVGD